MVPALPIDHCRRDRIGALLDGSGKRDQLLTLVSAPPGYGKTLAVAGWLASRGVPAAWYSIDPADDDASRFAGYLAAALDSVRPGTARSVARLLGPDLGVMPSAVAGALLAGIGRADEPFILVLDDYQVVHDGWIHGLVRTLIQHCPPWCRIVLITRRDPPFPLSRLRAAGRLLELRVDDLRFSESEARVLLDRALLVPLPDAALVRLLQRSEGWAAALQLTAISLNARSDAPGFLDDLAGTQRFLFDYLGDEVMDRVDPDLADFMVRTSIAERFTAGLANRLTGRADASELIARAARSNLFLTTNDPDAKWFRYHQLFRDYLRSRIPEGQLRGLHAVAAAYFEECGETPEALYHAFAADDTERAARLLASAARTMFEAGELTALTAYLGRLPPGAVAADPELRSLGAWSLFFQGDLRGAMSLAQGQATGEDQDSAAAGRLLAVQAAAGALGGGRLTEELARAGSERLESDPLFRALARLVVGQAELASGHPTTAARTLHEAIEDARIAGSTAAAVRIVYLLSTALLHEGRRTEAEDVAGDLLDELAQHPPVADAMSCLPRIARGMARFEANDLTEARRDLAAGFRDAWQTGFGRVLVGQGLEALALCHAATGDLDSAVGVTITAGRAARRVGAAARLPQLAALRAELDLQRGDVDRALEWAADARKSDQRTAIPPVEFLRCLTLARIRLAEGDLANAGQPLAVARDIAATAGSVPFLVSVATHEALTAALAGRQRDAVGHLAEAIERAAPGRYFRRVLDGGPPIARLLPFVRRIDSRFVDQLIAQFPAPHGRAGGGWSPRVEAKDESDGEGEPEALTARELDVLRRMAKGESNAQIAAALAVSAGTAKWHVGHVLSKLGARNRTDAILRGQRLGLIPAT